MSILQPQKTLLRLATENAIEDQLESHEEVELAMVLATQEAEKRAQRALKRVARRKKKRTRMCRTSRRLPRWFRYVTMFLCLAYCSVMAVITMVYGIKFTIRGEELARQQDLAQFSGINVTYFNDSNVTDGLTMQLMMKFELNGSMALERQFVTEEELAKVHNVSVDDVDLYLNKTVEIIRPVAGEVYGALSSLENVYGIDLNYDSAADFSNPT
jgi:hypothetical protein